MSGMRHSKLLVEDQELYPGIARKIESDERKASDSLQTAEQFNRSQRSAWTPDYVLPPWKWEGKIPTNIADTYLDFMGITDDKDLKRRASMRR
ncbi:hypothetical protein N7454_008736 [Penicillium verhagenii]|nr:hypothetical protein N7454_008736 [Penicillium verhagenii]